MRVGNCGRDFEAVADDARVGEQRSDFLGIVARDFLCVEKIEDFAVTRALEQNRVPAQASLRAFQDKKLEEHAIVVDRNAPFLVVIGDIDFFLRPVAAN